MNPWEKYAQPEADGPWSKYSGSTAVAEPTPEQPASLADKMAGGWGGRVLQGIASPLLAGAQIFGGDKGREMVAELEAMKKRGMKAEGNEGVDAMGMVGSLIPGAGIAKGVAAVLPAAKTLAGRLLQGGATGAVTAAAQPVAPSQTFWQDKAAQIGVGTGAGATIPALGQVARMIPATPNMNPVQAQTLLVGQQAGYVVPPSLVNPSFLSNRLESLAGKASVGQEAAKRNQEVTNALAARELGLPANTPLTEPIIEAVRKQAGKVYEDVKTVVPGRELQGLKVKTAEQRPTLPGPATGMSVKEIRGEAPNVFGLKAHEVRDEAGNLLGMRVGLNNKGELGPIESVKTKVTSRGEDVPGALERLKVQVKETRGGSPVDDLKQARADASAEYQHYATSKDPKDLAAAQGHWAKAEAIDDKLATSLKSKGREDLVQALVEARTKIAKTYDIERALNLGDAGVSAPRLGAALDKSGIAGKSGNLAMIGKMAEAFPSVMREGARIPASGVSGTDAAASAILGTMGYGTSGPAGLFAAGLPLLRGPARNLVLSNAYQKFATRDPQKYQAIVDILSQQGAGAAGTTAGRMQP